jgi:hypothetical protein
MAAIAGHRFEQVDQLGRLALDQVDVGIVRRVEADPDAVFAFRQLGLQCCPSFFSLRQVVEIVADVAGFHDDALAVARARRGGSNCFCAWGLPALLSRANRIQSTQAGDRRAADAGERAGRPHARFRHVDGELNAVSMPSAMISGAGGVSSSAIQNGSPLGPRATSITAPSASPNISLAGSTGALAGLHRVEERDVAARDDAVPGAHRRMHAGNSGPRSAFTLRPLPFGPGRALPPFRRRREAEGVAAGDRRRAARGGPRNSAWRAARRRVPAPNEVPCGQ